MNKPLLIFGLGEFAELAHYYFSQHGGRQVDAFTADAAFLSATRFAGLPVLPFDEAQRRFAPATHDMFVAIGYTQFNQVRERVFLQARALGYSLSSFVHEAAAVARNVRIGANTMLRERVVISPFAVLGDNIFAGMGASVSHHARIDSHAYLASDCVVCGSAVVGERCFIGANATVRDKVTVGAGCIVGAGALILSDCAAGGVYAATPTARRERA